MRYEDRQLIAVVMSVSKTGSEDADHSSRWGLGHETARDTTRIEAFSDAVIAIMLTLLAVELLQFNVENARKIGLLLTCSPFLLQS